QADCGIDTSIRIVDAIREDNKNKKIDSIDEIKEILINEIGNVYEEEKVSPIHYNLSGTTVILIVGVNGVGKTTSIAKLGKYYLAQGKTVAFAAGDTFRAGAREQLQLWANRLDVPCIAGKDRQDPSSVLVDACKYALNHKIDILLCDTAGRLQNKNNLMQELEKMHRVIGKTIPGQPMESWLVLDATTGQNGLSQAQVFRDSAKITGIILTKFDGTGRGGVILAIKHKWNLPVRFIGIGETADDLKEFRLEDFASTVLKGIEKNA
ncbi:MAG: signal recognition particle-docking protein FtsY, partial [Erysipelotrichales bacterium]|nr:signal recognition particle-docking protein FtsY [Erysipelotrichales bacterium]